MVGGLMITNKKYNNQKNHFSNYNALFAKGIIIKPLEEKDKSFKTVISVEQVIDSINTIKHTSGNLLVYIKKDSMLSTLEIGDEVLFQLNYKPVEGPKNIGQFNYKH